MREIWGTGIRRETWRDTNLDICGVGSLCDRSTSICLLTQIGIAPTLESE